MTETQEKEIKLAYLWKRITDLAFHPSSSIEINDWLSIYCKSVVDFWEVADYPKLNRFTIEVANNDIPIDFKFVYTDTNKFSVSFYYLGEDNNDFAWMHDVDKNFFTPEQYILSYDNHMPKNLKKISEDDVNIVLEGLLFHPTAHQHISEDDRHEIRIGGGFQNPFQFLFHLRFQLCLIDRKRELERNRLTSLFYNAVQKKCTGISPSQLLHVK
jgi:hypothetical protein